MLSLQATKKKRFEWTKTWPWKWKKKFSHHASRVYTLHTKMSAIIKIVKQLIKVNSVYHEEHSTYLTFYWNFYEKINLRNWAPFQKTRKSCNLNHWNVLSIFWHLLTHSCMSSKSGSDVITNFSFNINLLFNFPS